MYVEDDSYYAVSMLPVMRLGRILKIFRSARRLYLVKDLYTFIISRIISLASTTFLNAINNLDPIKRKENKGVGAGGDSSDAVENLYKFYFYNRKEDVESVLPNVILGNEKDQSVKPYLYELYRKPPTTLNQLIQMNNSGNQPVLTNAIGNAVVDLNFNVKK